MGVLSCNRRGCRNIMCDLYSPTYGHICSDCFRELVASGATTDIKEFMDSEPTLDTSDEAHARYSAVFTWNWDD